LAFTGNVLGLKGTVGAEKLLNRRYTGGGGETSLGNQTNESEEI
jgi:hypothetical protein